MNNENYNMIVNSLRDEINALNNDEKFNNIGSEVKDNSDLINELFQEYNQLSKTLINDLNTTEIYNITNESETDLDIDKIIDGKIAQCTYKYTEIFLRSISIEEIESGYISESEKIFNNIVNEYGYRITLEYIQKLFLENSSNVKFMKSILFILSEVPYDKIKNIGYTIPLAAINIDNNEVKDLALSCYEKWGSKEYLSFLKSIKFEQDWLNSYLAYIIKTLENCE